MSTKFELDESPLGLEEQKIEERKIEEHPVEKPDFQYMGKELDNFAHAKNLEILRAFQSS